MIIIHPEILKGTASSGSLSKSTIDFRSTRLKHIVVEPNTATTTYDFSVEDPDSITVVERTNRTGTLSIFVDMPLRGQHTAKIANASADEQFTIKLLCEE